VVHFIPSNALGSLDVSEQPQLLPDMVENMQDDTLQDSSLFTDVTPQISKELNKGSYKSHINF